MAKSTKVVGQPKAVKPRMLDFLREGQISSIPPVEIPEEDRLEKPATFYTVGWEKFFIAILETPLPTGQMRNRKERYRPFVEALRAQVELLGRDPDMPYKERLDVLISINGPKEYVQRVDLDNMVKTLLDCVKGILFVDDKQVFNIEASKHIQEPPGILFGVRRQDGSTA
jgi:Holliday junction resolvase RusA-like endonuclease